MTRETEYKYTLVIPSRNRQRYCVEAVQSALYCDRDDLQIIVADNSDDGGLLPHLLKEADALDKITFLATPDSGPVPMRQNWERTVDHIRGEWITYIGDDDGVLASGYDLLDGLTEHFNVRAFTWRPLYYKWPCFPEADRGVLDYATFDLQVAVSNGAKFLAGHQEWRTEDKWPVAGPSVYHGAVHISVLEETKENFGECFINFIVDYASAMTTCMCVTHFMHSMWPVTVMGACALSNTAGLTATGAAKKRVEELRSENEGLQAMFDSFQETRLMSPWVVAGYSKILERIGLPFYMTPRKFLRATLMELVRVRDPDMFAAEKERLIRFRDEHGVSDIPVEMAQFRRTKPEFGYFTEPRRLVIDTNALGWTGMLDVVKGYGAFRRNPASERAMLDSLAPMIAEKNADVLRVKPKKTVAGVPLDLPPLETTPEIEDAMREFQPGDPNAIALISALKEADRAAADI